MTEKFIPRYNLRQRIAHWTWTIAGLALLVSGILILLGASASLTRIAVVVHRLAAVEVIVAVLFYLVSAPREFWQLVSEALRYDRDDVIWFKRAYRHFLGRSEGMPPQGRHNAGEKFHHLMNLALLATIGASGLILWWGKEVVSPKLFTGALLVHNLSMLGIVVLLAGHVFFTFVYDMLMSMTYGVVTRRFAEHEHAKWLAKVEEVTD